MKLTVIISTYDCRHQISQAIDSVLFHEGVESEFNPDRCLKELFGRSAIRMGGLLSPAQTIRRNDLQATTIDTLGQGRAKQCDAIKILSGGSVLAGQRGDQ